MSKNGNRNEEWALFVNGVCVYWDGQGRFRLEVNLK